MELPKAIKDRIEKTCLEFYPVELSNYRGDKTADLNEPERSILYGAMKSEALRCQPLLEALEKISAVMEKPTIYDPGQEIYQMCEMAAEALAKYNSK